MSERLTASHVRSKMALVEYNTSPSNFTKTTKRVGSGTHARVFEGYLNFTRRGKTCRRAVVAKQIRNVEDDEYFQIECQIHHELQELWWVKVIVPMKIKSPTMGSLLCPLKYRAHPKIVLKTKSNKSVPKKSKFCSKNRNSVPKNQNPAPQNQNI